MDNKQLLSEFNEIIKYGSKKLSQTEIEFQNIRAKKKSLFFMMGVAQSYTKSIYKLLTPPDIFEKSAEVMYRSLFENYINMLFVFSGRNNKNAIIFATQHYQDSIKYANRYKELMIKYPLWDLKFNESIKTIADWGTFITKQKKHIEKIEKKYNVVIPKKYSLLDRAIEHDKVLADTGKLKHTNSLEYAYIYYYKYFSDSAHLNSSGIEKFITNKDRITRLDINAPIENITTILKISYLIYYFFLKFYLVQFGFYKKDEFVHFNKIRKLLLKK